MADDLIAGKFRHLLRQIVYETHLRVDDLSATHTDKVGMRIGPAAIVTIIVVAETEFEHPPARRGAATTPGYIL